MLADVRSHLWSLAFRVDGALVSVDLRARGGKERAPGRVVVGSVGVVPSGPFGHDSNDAECGTVTDLGWVCGCSQAGKGARLVVREAPVG